MHELEVYSLHLHITMTHSLSLGVSPPQPSQSSPHYPICHILPYYCTYTSLFQKENRIYIVKIVPAYDFQKQYRLSYFKNTSMFSLLGLIPTLPDQILCRPISGCVNTISGCANTRECGVDTVGGS